MPDADAVVLLDLSLAYGLEQLVEFDTYIGSHGSSWLDLFLTDHSDSFSVESYPFASDHVVVTPRGNVRIPPPAKHERIIRQYHRTEWDGVRNFVLANP